MPLTVRQTGLPDAPALGKLRWRWRAEERGERGPSRDEFVAAFAKWMSEHDDTHLAWLAEADEEPVGMAWLAMIHRIPGPGHWLRLAGNLQSVYVVPERRASGIGEHLLQAVLDGAHARGLECISVHPSPRSFPLYRRLGLEESPGVLELRRSVAVPRPLS